MFSADASMDTFWSLLTVITLFTVSYINHKFQKLHDLSLNNIELIC